MVRIVSLVVLVGLAAQISACAFDACGECLGGADARHHDIAFSITACHNCICIGSAAVAIVTLIEPQAIASSAAPPEVRIPDSPHSERFIPPRGA